MGQYWELVNITREESGILRGGAKQVEFFYEKHVEFVRSLTIPFRNPKVKAWLEGPIDIHPRQSDMGILRFPNEILLEIFKHCDIHHKIYLALTCRRMLSISLDDIEKNKSKLAAPWVNTRIICVGDYAHDLPRGVLTKSQQTALSKSDDYDKYNYGGLGSMLNKSVTLFTGKINGHKPMKEFIARLPGHDYYRLKELYSLYYPTRDDWVACNLSKGYYVRASSVAKLSKQPAITSPFMLRCKQDLGHAILSQICWTSDPSGCLVDDRGSWAGKRFCITTLGRMPILPEGKEWIDVSAKICWLLKDVWEDEW